jgi:cysteine desulfurase
MKKTIYLDNGATTMLAKEVVKEMLHHLSKSYGNASSLHALGREANRALENSRLIIAKKINAEPDEIIFTSGGSESNNLAIKGFAFANREQGNHIITSKFEHPAVIETCRSLKKEGFEITYARINKDGFIDLDELKESITDKTILVTIMAANNEVGTIQPIAEIGRICRERSIVFHTDAVQAFTKTPIDVKAMNIDLLSLSAHKLHGPKGTGALFIRKGIKIKRLIDGGPQERRLRAGTENIAGIAGFAKAAELTTKEDVERMTRLRDKLIDNLLSIPDAKLNGSRANRLCNNANISFKGVEGEATLLRLDEKGIAVSTGSACSSHELKPSHVLLAMGLSPVEAHGSLRFTLSKYTTEQEIDYLTGVLPKIIKDLRRISPIK